jgi:hypothetical protein
MVKWAANGRDLPDNDAIVQWDDGSMIQGKRKEKIQSLRSHANLLCGVSLTLAICAMSL